MRHRIVIISPDEVHQRDILTALLTVVGGVELLTQPMMPEAIKQVRKGDIVLISTWGPDPADTIDKIKAVDEEISITLMGECTERVNTKFKFNHIVDFADLPPLIRKLTGKK